MEKGLKYEPPRRVTPGDEPPVLAVCEPAVALVEVPLVAAVLGVLPPVALAVGAPPACGEPAAAWV
ncbi:MAG TPA: hypothetical protein VLR69_17555 [Thermoanaerobaculia bacterium]|nr:hypothetical protein [Thermoanaerobaculia bacterium]